MRIGEILEEGEKASLEKARISRFYRQEADLDLIKMDDQGKHRHKQRLFELLSDPGLVDARLKAKPLSELEVQGRVFKNKIAKEQLILDLIKRMPFYDKGRFDAELELNSG